jgi:hypothetical protein
MRWLHAIRQDKRMDRDKTEAEIGAKYLGARISLTFRQIGTFLNADQTLIWGQGATSKTRAGAQKVVNGQTPEAVKMLQAFGTENHASEFDWEQQYGGGFNVVHMSTSPRWFSGPDPVVNMRVALMLAEYGISYAKGNIGRTVPAGDADRTGEDVPVKFVDNDPGKSVVEGSIAIMLYLDAVRGSTGQNEAPVSHSHLARRLTRFQEALTLLERWRAASRPQREESVHDTRNDGKKNGDILKSLRKELTLWNDYAKDVVSGKSALRPCPAPALYIAGGERASIADFALWPVLHDMVGVVGEAALLGYGDLAKYYTAFRERKPVAKLLGRDE